MKIHTTVAIFIVVLSGVFNNGCVEESNGSDKTIQEPPCKTEGFVRCNGLCIDPKTSNLFCGANENCENYVACQATDSCFESRCRPTICEPDEHHYDVICEKDSVDHCGEHGFNCSDKIDGWKSGDCIKKECTPSTCSTGRHPYENSCELDDIHHCGSHDTDCSIDITGWSDGTCDNGVCHVHTCLTSLHPYNNTCEPDDVENCGIHAKSCNITINGWASGECVQETCTVRTCAEGMHVYENACEADSVENCVLHGRVCANTVVGWESGACTQGTCKVLQCINGFHVNAATGECVQDTNECCGSACEICGNDFLCADGKCQTKCQNTETYCSVECVNINSNISNCGECGHDCNLEKPENVKTMHCLNSTCEIFDCDLNYHIEIKDGKRICKEDTINACGTDATDCTASAWWNEGICTNGKCIPNVCKSDYHLVQNDSGENWCEPDSNLNCGSHGFNCTSDQMCAGGRCLGRTICDDVLRNTLTDLDHCGACNHRCDDGLICDRGQCKPGTGMAYCSDTKVTVGTIEHCNGCSDRCAEGLICHEGICQEGNGLMYCSDVKINSTLDSAHCGGCGNLCPVGSMCSNHSDTLDCIDGTGTTYCDGKAINTSNDSANCGQCGNYCDVGEICTDGICTIGVGTTICNGITQNTSNDLFNCGQCGNYCGMGMLCKTGVCSLIHFPEEYEVTANFDFFSNFTPTSENYKAEMMTAGDWVNFVISFCNSPRDSLFNFVWDNIITRLAETDAIKNVPFFYNLLTGSGTKELAIGALHDALEPTLQSKRWYRTINRLAPDIADIVVNFQLHGKYKPGTYVSHEMQNMEVSFDELQYQWSLEYVGQDNCIDNAYGNSKCRRKLPLARKSTTITSTCNPIIELNPEPDIDAYISFQVSDLTFKWATIIYNAIFGEMLPLALDYYSNPDISRGLYIKPFFEELLFIPVVNYYVANKQDKDTGETRDDGTRIYYPVLGKEYGYCEQFVEGLIYMTYPRLAEFSNAFKTAAYMICSNGVIGQLDTLLLDAFNKVQANSSLGLVMQIENCPLYINYNNYYSQYEYYYIGKPDTSFSVPSAHEVFGHELVNTNRCKMNVSKESFSFKGIYHGKTNAI